MSHARVTGSLPAGWPVVRVLGIVGLLRKPAFLQPGTPPDVRLDFLDAALGGVFALHFIDK